ncbi:DUF5723 family protein [Bacteroidota bacterium]
MKKSMLICSPLSISKLSRQLGLLTALFLLSFSNLQGQHSNTLFQMHSIAQSNHLNPAVKPNCKVYFGIPILNTIDLTYSNSSFTINNLIENDQVQLDGFYNRLSAMNIISVKLLTYPFSAGFYYKKHYFTFSIAERVRSYVSFPKDLVGLALYGNAQYIGKKAKLSPVVDATYYRAYNFGWAFDMDEYNSLGVKGKLLFGKANAGTGSSKIVFGVGEDFPDLFFEGDVSVNAAFPLNISLDNKNMINGVDVTAIDPVSFLLNRGNPGIAFDFGYINTYVPDFTFSASVLDLGAILWKDEVNNISATTDIIFQGISVNPDFDFGNLENILGDFADSILNKFQYNVTQDSYVKFLPTQVYLGAAYRLSTKIDLGLTVRNSFESKTVKSSVTTSVNYTLFNTLQTFLSWSYANKSLKNFGAGIAYTGKGFQFYAVSDNVYGFIRPVDSRLINFRFGMNLMFGCSSFAREVRYGGHSMVPCPPGKTNRVKKSTRK